MEKNRVLNEILKIEKSGKFNEGVPLPGSHEFVASLNNFERAIYTYAINISKLEMESSKKLFQISAISGFMWFSIISRLDLWDKPDSYGINNGKSLVIVDEESFTEAMGIKIEIKKINSVDELPEEIREELMKSLMLSKSFGNLGKFSVN